MSETLRDSAETLLGAEPEEFDDKETYREWVDERLADLEHALEDVDDRVDAREAHGEALSTKLDEIRTLAETASERSRRAEQVASWGGLGYKDRLERVVETLARRAADSSDDVARISTTTEVRVATGGGRYEVPGVVDLFDGAVSDRTCRNYVRDLGDLEGMTVEDARRGGYGGGSESKQLRLDLSEFVPVYGGEWSIDDLLEDLREEGDA